MTWNKQASKWRHKVDRDRAATEVVVAVMVERKGTRLLRVIHLGIQVPVRISSGKGNKWRRKLMVVARRVTAMRMQYKFKAVARRATAMMMATRLWR